MTWSHHIRAISIMVLFVLCKLIIQTHMRSHPMGLAVWSNEGGGGGGASCLIFSWTFGLFLYFMCANSDALARLWLRAASPRSLRWSPMWLSTIISWNWHIPLCLDTQEYYKMKTFHQIENINTYEALWCPAFSKKLIHSCRLIDHLSL